MEKTSEIYLAGGCFWGTEHFLKQIRGVKHTEVGYANGNTASPTYKEVCTDKTGFAETVKVVYNPQEVSLELLLNLYFQTIDPTSINRQGHDQGTQYRTGIYYTDKADLTIIQNAVCELAKEYSRPLALEVEPLKNFYNAEEYHQNYLDKNPDGYLGEANNIHPKNKQEVGLRLSQLALKQTYKKKRMPQSPLFKSYRIEGNTIRIGFDNPGKGFMKPDTIKGFIIAGADHIFYPATVTIQKKEIIVESPDVPHPVAVRYNWADNPDGNLYGLSGLPTAPFRTDNW